MYITKARYILLAYQTLIMIFLAAAIGTNTGGISSPNWGGLALLMVVLFFESCIFPTIFTLSLRGLGRHTKRGASFLVASVCGGAVIPAILGTTADKIGTRKAMIVPLAFFLIAWAFPIYLNAFKAKELDAYSHSNVGVEPGSIDPDSRVGSVSMSKDMEANHVEVKN
jgi:FHS family L-fucose permease-like MFS transporter